MSSSVLAIPAPVPPEQVTGPLDRFVCVRMKATLTAGECKKRHAAAHADLTGKPSAKKMTARMLATSATACRGCELGPTTIHPKVP